MYNYNFLVIGYIQHICYIFSSILLHLYFKFPCYHRPLKNVLEQKLPSPPPLGFVKVAQMLDLLGLKNLLDVFIDSGVTDEDAFNPENETEIGEILSGNGIMTEDVTFILHYIQNINQLAHSIYLSLLI